MNSQLNPNDIDVLVDILAAQASDSLAGTPQEYFDNLLTSAHLPQKWLRSIAGKWSGNANYDARKLVNWAITKKINPDDPSYTTLGALLRVLIGQELSPDDATAVAAIMVSYGLVLDEKQPSEIRIRYSLPARESDGLILDDKRPDEVKTGYAIPVRASTPAAATPLTASEQEEVVRIISMQVDNPFLDKPQDYFNDLVASADLPARAKFAGRWTGDPGPDARLLLAATLMLQYPNGHERAGQTTLGWVLREILGRLPLSPSDSMSLVKIILTHNLISDPETLQTLRVQYSATGGFSV